MSVNPNFLLDNFAEYCESPTDDKMKECLQLLCCCSQDELRFAFDGNFETFARILNRPSKFMINMYRKNLEETGVES